MKTVSQLSVLAAVICCQNGAQAFFVPTTTIQRNHPVVTTSTALFASTDTSKVGARHGENACFMPLKQLDQDYYAPRIIQIAGAYPGLTRADLFAVSSEDAPEVGQWSYDFSDPEGPQMGTVAVDGSFVVSACDDPVVVIAEHTALGVTLSKEIENPVDLLVVIDRALKDFAERKFLVLDIPGEEEILIRAFASKAEMPADATIIGQVELVQIPWLPSMAPTKTGFMEADEYF